MTDIFKEILAFWAGEQEKHLGLANVLEPAKDAKARQAEINRQKMSRIQAQILMIR